MFEKEFEPKAVEVEPEKEKGDEVFDFLKENTRKLLERVKELAPSLEHVYRRGREVIKWLSVAAVLIAAESEAQVKENVRAGDIFSDPKIGGVVSDSSLGYLYKECNRFNLGSFKEDNSLVKLRMEENNGRYQRDIEGGLPPQRTDFGNVGVVTKTRSLQREITESAGGEGSSKSERVFTFETEIVKPVSPKAIKGTGKKLQATAFGKTDQEAIISAIGSLSRQQEVYVRRAFAQKSTEGGGKFLSKTTDVVTADSKNYLAGVKVVSLKQVEGGLYEVQVEAESGERAD